MLPPRDVQDLLHPVHGRQVSDLPSSNHRLGADLRALRERCEAIRVELQLLSVRLDRCVIVSIKLVLRQVTKFLLFMLWNDPLVVTIFNFSSKIIFLSLDSPLQGKID